MGESVGGVRAQPSKWYNNSQLEVLFTRELFVRGEGIFLNLTVEMSVPLLQTRLMEWSFRLLFAH